MKKLLILDLDETLVYANEKPLERKHDFVAGEYFVYFRPFLREFIDSVKDEFEVGVWTTSGSIYANTVVEEIFGSDYPLSFVWSREKCTRKYDLEYHEHYYIKNLSKLKRKGFELENVIMVDNTPRKLENHYGNLVRVLDFEGDPNDYELDLLKKYLSQLSCEPNIRKVEKRGWQSNFAP